ncbi:MAG: altronate hydrolase [Polaromonas sp.]|jgi:altronate hydrolase
MINNKGDKMTKQWTLKTLALCALLTCVTGNFSLAQAKTKLKWAHVYEASEPFHQWSVWAGEESDLNQGDMNNNPSPGNKADGLTTILEKSLGAVVKSGTNNLQAVYEYAEKVTAHGFVYMDTPGYDPVSATGQVAGGANLICFTTGRGSAYGCAPSPSLKLSTNSALWAKQEDDLDLNCGEIINGTSTVAEMGQRIFVRLLATASGEHNKSEKHGYGQNEFVPGQVGAVM